MSSLSIIIPVFNSEGSLDKLAGRLISAMEQLSTDFEVILVEDSSSDGSWEKILEICGSDRRFRGIQLSRNFGQHNALLCGIRAARKEIIITMDDDLQHPPEEIPLLLGKLREGFDVVYGVPVKFHHGILRNLASNITKLALSSAMGAKTARQVSAFRAFPAWLRVAFADYKTPYVSIDVLLTMGTSRFSSVPVRNDPRTMGESNYTLKKLVLHALNMITGFSTLPLRLSSIIGFIFTVFGVCVLIFVLIRYIISGTTAPGFTFLASVISIFSGAQLFALGIIGEYLARVHHRTMDRPAYLVRSSVRGQNKNEE